MLRSIDYEDDTPPFKQIAQQIREGILEGDYRVGALIPSISYTARICGVAQNTVKSAYSLLRKEGLIITLHGKGSYVKYRG